MSLLKILFLGLDYAGKTSYIYSLEGRYSELIEISPTMRIGREKLSILGIPIAGVWDLGGQSRYRKGYIEQPEVFDGTDGILYLIDMKDKDRFEESITYFKEILLVLKVIKIFPVITICLHKCDPDLMGDNRLLGRIRKIRQQYKDILAENSKFERYKTYLTSIFDRSSLIRAFSHTISQLMPDFNVIDNMLEGFSKEIGPLFGALMFDENLMISGSYFADDIYERIIFSAIDGIATIVEKVKETNYMESHIDTHLSINNGQRTLEFYFRKVKIGEIPFYLLLLNNKPLKVFEIMRIFVNKYVPILETVIQQLSKRKE